MGPVRAAAAKAWLEKAPAEALVGEGLAEDVPTGDALVGGLYGVRLGGAFFGESMFHRARDCSKLALVHLVARLKAGGFALLDTQFITDHLKQFGAIEIERRDYRRRLEAARFLQEPHDGRNVLVG